LTNYRGRPRYFLGEAFYHYSTVSRRPAMSRTASELVSPLIFDSPFHLLRKTSLSSTGYPLCFPFYTPLHGSFSRHTLLPTLQSVPPQCRPSWSVSVVEETQMRPEVFGPFSQSEEPLLHFSPHLPYFITPFFDVSARCHCLSPLPPLPPRGLLAISSFFLLDLPFPCAVDQAFKLFSFPQRTIYSRSLHMRLSSDPQRPVPSPRHTLFGPPFGTPPPNKLISCKYSDKFTCTLPKLTGFCFVGSSFSSLFYPPPRR